MPNGTVVHNIELLVGRGGQIVRSAGASAQLMAKEEQVLPAAPALGRDAPRARGLHGDGRPGGQRRSTRWSSSARPARIRWRGRRPQVRGSAMNPVDHPHGGGEGKAPIGHPGPKTPWGKPTLGYRTRGKKQSDKLIVRRRLRVLGEQ